MRTELKVNVELHQNKLRLRWSDGIGRKVLSLGVADDPDGRKLAYQLKDQIEQEFTLGVYDPTLMRYKASLANTKAIVTCPELFDLFTKNQIKQKSLGTVSVRTRYIPILSVLEQHLNVSAKFVTRSQIEHFKTAALDHLNPNTAKTRVWLLQACWNWAQGKYLVQAENPWSQLTGQFKSIPIKPAQPFTAAEVQLILNGFKQSPYYAHYYDFTFFLFGVGCRFGEAVALRWSDLGTDCTTVWISQTMHNGQRNTVKSGKARAVNLSPSVVSMLQARRATIPDEQFNSDDLVFKTPEGHPLNDRNYRRRAWTKTLEAVGVPYRKPYTTRATAISHALASGANYVAVAKAAGHDPQVMHAHYANTINRDSVFVDFTPPKH